MSHGTNSSLSNIDQTTISSNDYLIVEAENEEQLVRNTVQIIANKFPNDIQSGKEFKHTHNKIDETIIIGDHIREVDFIVDLSGEIHFGRGHAFLARRADVQAAGTVKIGANKKIRRITNGSGHYRPTAEETARYIEVFKKAGFDVSHAWLTVYDLRKSPSGNHTDGHGIIYDGYAKQFRG